MLCRMGSGGAEHHSYLRVLFRKPVARKTQGFLGFRADHALRLLAFLFENVKKVFHPLGNLEVASTYHGPKGPTTATLLLSEH